MSASGGSAWYSEILKDPRWQKKRLEIMSRDGFKCVNCEASDKTLHVHHLRYLKGKKPWEHGDENLQTLCVDCHATESVVDERLKEAIFAYAIFCGGKEGLLGYLEAAAAYWHFGKDGDHAPLSVKIISTAHACGIAKWLREQDAGVDIDGAGVVALATIDEESSLAIVDIQGLLFSLLPAGDPRLPRP
jgi:hypothetical protein